MKLTGAGVESFVKRPDAKIKAVLLYGPDAGLVHERMNALTVSVAGTLDDPFRIGEFSSSALRDDGAKLADEAAALSFSGGRRVVRIRAENERLDSGVAEAFEAFFENPVGDALVILAAGDVGTRAALVRLFENAEIAASIGCYLDDARTLETVIRDGLKKAGLTATPDALAYLNDHLGGDREVTRRELEKLALYVGGPGTVTEEDAMACIGDASGLALDDLVMAVGDGDHATMQRIYARLMDEGVSPYTVISAVSRHLLRLHETAGRVAAGSSLDQAMFALKPPPFYKVKDRFRQQAGRWSASLAAQALDMLTAAEMKSKAAEMPSAALVERALMQIAQAGRRK